MVPSGRKRALTVATVANGLKRSQMSQMSELSQLSQMSLGKVYEGRPNFITVTCHSLVRES